MKRSRSRYRWTSLLASALLSSWQAAAMAANPSVGTVADSDAALSVIDDAGISMGVGDDLYLEVLLNQQPTGQLAHFGLRNGRLLASRHTLQRLGFRLPLGGPDPQPLDRLPGVLVHYDAARQQVAITAPLTLLDLKTAVLNARDDGEVPAASASPGVLLNYDVYGTAGEKHSGSLSAYTELRAFGAGGVFSTTSLDQFTRLPGQGWRSRFVRLQSSWQTSFPERMTTLRVGDTLTGSLAWSRATHIAGVQLSRDFALQPYRITTPVPVFLGQATVPSAVDLYINGIKQYSGEVAPGPFQLNGAPIINGSGNAQVVLTDALGRSTRIDFPFYTTAQLLQQGLSDWSVELGVVRRSYGQKSFDYGHRPALSGTWRYGISNRFTAQAHAETTVGVANAGIGGVWLLGAEAGVLNASFARSRGQGRHGGQYSLGYQWRHGPFNFSLDSKRSHGDYRDVASLYGAPPPRVSERALIGVSSTHLGSFSLSYLHLRQADHAGSTYFHLPSLPFGGNVADSAGQDSRYASAFWFRSIGRRMSVNASVNQNLDDHRDRSIFLGLSISLDDRTQLSASAQRNRSRDSFSVSADHAVPSEGGFGWHAQGRSGDGQRGGLAEVGYRGDYGQIDTGVNVLGDRRYAYASGNGALVWMGGGLFASRRIDDAFAVVSTNGIADVPVKLENRVIGRTNQAGLLLVTPLNAWQKNQVAIDPMNLPADVQIDHVKTFATPSDRAGTLVRFGITPMRAASIILHDAAGKPLPVGSPAHLLGQKDTGALVGFDGALYLDTLQDRNTLEVVTPGGTCRVSFDYRKQGNGIPEIGPLTCQTGKDP